MEDILIYIVDNESGITFVLSEIIESFGYKTKTFPNPIEAIACLEADRPQVIISDFKMPEMHGVDFLKVVNEKKLDIPFIFFSAFLTKEVTAEAIRLGVFGLMEKPFKEPVLRSYIENAINNYRYKKFLNSKLASIQQIILDVENEEVANKIENVLSEIKNNKVYFKF